MRQTDKLEMITKVLNEKSVPIPLQDAVLKHFRNYFKDVSAFDVDGMLDRLPHSLANEVQLFHHERTLKNISFLKYIDNVTIRLYIYTTRYSTSLNHIILFFFLFFHWCCFFILLRNIFKHRTYAKPL